MKPTNKFLFSALSAAALFSLLAGNGQAQYRPTGDDGITASPKARAILNERKAASAWGSSSPEVVVYQARGESGIVASPKTRQLLEEFQVAPEVPSDSAGTASYQPVG